MRMLLILGLIVGGLIVAGVISVQKSGDDVQITIDKKKAAQTAQKILDKGRDVVEDAEEALEQASRENHDAPAAR